MFDLLGSQDRGRVMFCSGLGLIPTLNRAAGVRVRSLPNIKVDTSNPATVVSSPSETPFITRYLLISCIYIVCRHSLPVASLVRCIDFMDSANGCLVQVFGYSWLLIPSIKVKTVQGNSQN